MLLCVSKADFRAHSSLGSGSRGTAAAHTALLTQTSHFSISTTTLQIEYDVLTVIASKGAIYNLI